MPTRVDCGAADDRRDLPVKVNARQVFQTSIPHRRQGTTNDFSLECNTQERHARRLTCGERLPFPASTARIGTTETVITSFSPATNPFPRPGLPLRTEIPASLRSVPHAGAICADALPQPWIREDLRRAHRESRDDQCSLPHHLPGITAKLLSLTLLRNFPRQTPLERTLPRNLHETSAAYTILRVSEFFRDKCRRHDTAGLRIFFPGSYRRNDTAWEHSETILHRWNDTTSEFPETLAPLKRHRLGMHPRQRQRSRWQRPCHRNFCSNPILPSQPFATSKPDVCSDYHTSNRRLRHSFSMHRHCRTEKFHFIGAVQFSRHAYLTCMLAMTMKVAASIMKVAKTRYAFVCRDLCICLQCVSVPCE